MSKLPKVKDVEELKEYVTTNIEKFRVDNLDFHADFKTQNEIIRRYDEVLSSKTSKSAFEGSLSIIDERLINYKKEVDEKFKEVNHEAMSTGARIDILREAVMEEIDHRILGHLKKERLHRSQQPQVQQTDIFSTDGGISIKKMLALKADKTDLDRVFELKCNKIDIENLLDIQQIISK